VRKLRTARAIGVSLRRFDGWEPVETTEVIERDSEGRPSKWRTTRDPEWTIEERSWMLALGLYEDGLCNRCGVSLAESTSDDVDPWKPEATHQYVAEVPITCFHCLVLAKSEKKYANDEDNEPGALIHTAIKIAKPPRKRKRV
jgi:hypothetical protein